MNAADLLERARQATNELRDAARTGRVIEFRQRDPLVMAIHDALDLVATAHAEGRQAEREARRRKSGESPYDLSVGKKGFRR